MEVDVKLRSIGLKSQMGGLMLGLGLVISSGGSAAMGIDGSPAESSESSVGQDVPSGPAVQRLRSKLRLLLLDLVQAGEFGEVPAEHISLDLQMPAERVATLGILVDSRSGANAAGGLAVLGTTPGGFADTLGVHGGDVIVAINDTSLVALGDDEDGSARAADILRRQFASLAEGAAIRFKLRRGDKEKVVTGNVRKIWIPAVHLRLGGSPPIQPGTSAVPPRGSLERCGRISVFDNAPPQRDLHPVTLISIDDRHSPFDGQTSFRVSTGTHVIALAENVDSGYLGFNSRLRDNQGPSRYKSLTIEVKADTTYRLATHIVAEHRNEWRNSAWWEPVIWSESSEPCR